MAVESLTEFPSFLVSGDTLRVTLSDADYPSSSWGLRVYFRGAVLKDFGADAIANNQFEVVIPASSTAELTPGTYTVTFVYTETSTSERKTVVFGDVEVLANPSEATVKTIARQTLEAMEAALLLLAAGSNQTVNFNGQSFTKKNTAELQNAISRQRGIVLAEEGRAGLLAGSRRANGIFIRFA